MRIEQLMCSIFRCDLNRVTKILRQLETELAGQGANTGNSSANKRLKKILNERCDGNRNIFHAAVFVCAPTSNNNLSGVTAKATQSPAQPASGLRPSKFSDSGLGIYAAYGTCSSYQNLGGAPAASGTAPTGSSPGTTKPPTIERPWSTCGSNKNPGSELTFRKINISLESNSQPIKQQEGEQQQQQEAAIPTTFRPPLPPSIEEPMNTSKYTPVWSQVKLGEKDRKQNGLKILQELLASPIFQQGGLYELLSHKAAEGQTPFMYAVHLRAYEAGSLLFEQALKMRQEFTTLAGGSNQAYNRDMHFTNLVFPLGSRTDQSPLYVLCSNDTCSFTWTGDNHITQDIFECRTCTLVGNLCCCSECARTCHKGHDCKIKTSSPTAYCDCWEKCKCKSLIAGDQEKRFGLLERLLAETNLLSVSSCRGESLLIYLAQTVARQMQEQRNYKRVGGGGGGGASSSASSTSSSCSRRNQPNGGAGYNSNSEAGSSSLMSGLTGSIGDMPQHDLEPPKFSRRALEKIFNDWFSVKQIFLHNKARFHPDSQDIQEEDGFEEEKRRPTNTSQFLYSSSSLLFDESVYADSQSGCVDLDKFIYILVNKCPSELLAILVETLQRQMSATAAAGNDAEAVEDRDECELIARRLVRSVARLFVILCIETSPTSLNLNLSLTASGTSVQTEVNSLTSTLTTLHTNPQSPKATSINSRLARFKSLGGSSSMPASKSNETTNTSGSSQIASLVTVTPIAKCEYVLRQLPKHAVEELANVAHSLIEPVVLGLTKPSTFKLSVNSSNGNVVAAAAPASTSFNTNSTSASEFLGIGSGAGGSSGIGGTGSSSMNALNNQSLAEEIFNVEATMHRQLTSAITTSLITPPPAPRKLPRKEEPPRNLSFINTFETVNQPSLPKSNKPIQPGQPVGKTEHEGLVKVCKTRTHLIRLKIEIFIFLKEFYIDATAPTCLDFASSGKYCFIKHDGRIGQQQQLPQQQWAQLCGGKQEDEPFESQHEQQ